MEEPDQDQRRAKRIEKPFVLRLQKTSGSATKEWSFIFLRDISVGGLSFRSREVFLEGEVLNLKVSVIPNAPPIICRSEVVRCRPLGGERFFETALVFIDISQEDAEQIDRVVNENNPGAGA